MSVYTPQQQKILAALSDGLHHSRSELREIIGLDEHDDSNALRVLVSNLRKILRVQGQDIVCEVRREMSYYRLIPPAADTRNEKS